MIHDPENGYHVAFPGCREQGVQIDPIDFEGEFDTQETSSLCVPAKFIGPSNLLFGIFSRLSGQRRILDDIYID